MARDPNTLDEFFSSSDDLDLAMIEFGMGLDGMTEEPTDEGGEPRLNPLHDEDSLDFYLWIEQDVDKEAARRAAEKAAEGGGEKK